MTGIRPYIIARICFTLICAGLTGCAATSEDQPSETPQASESIAPEPVESEQDNDDNSIAKDNIDAIDYTPFLKKMWVVREWDGGAYTYPFSFIITKIENGMVEGMLATRSLVYTTTENLFGEINGNAAVCQFDEKDGNSGNIDLLFKENNEIEASIEYTKKNEIYKDMALDGTYLLRPYNLADEEEIINPLKTRTFQTDLKGWGTVNFVTVEMDAGNKVYPAAYLTNENGDILEEFSAAYQVGTEITDVTIEDVNGDGLDEVKITTQFIGDGFIIERFFSQRDNGLFSED